MKIGDILYHEQHGKLVVSGSKYSPIGNRVVLVAKDEKGKERPLDGTETPYANHLKAMRSDEESVKKEAEAEGEKGKKHDEIIALLSEVKEAITTGNDAILKKEVVNVETKEVTIPAFPKEMTVNVPDLSDIEKKLDKIVSKDDTGTKELIRDIISELKQTKTDKGVSDAIIGLGKILPKTTDYSGILKEISEKIVKEIPIDTFKIDEDQFKLLTKAIANIRGGGGSGGLVAVMDVERNQINPATEEKQDLELTAVKRGLYIPTFNYCAQVQASTTDTWTFKTGGAGGTTVATVVITYTDSTKAVISNVAQS